MLDKVAQILKTIKTWIDKPENNRKVAIILCLLIVVIGVGLSLMRDSTRDDNEYLMDTMVMSNVLKRGEWFGNYAVGLHGFLLKIPVAIAFMLTGPSVFAATLTTVIFAGLTCWMFYRLLYDVLKFRGWALIGVILLATSFQFVTYLPTFYRDIPAIFFFLLFLYSVFKKWNLWWSGLFLLLLLDTKEHIFFTVLPGILIWIVYSSFSSTHAEVWFKKVLEMLKRGIVLLIPSVVYLVLMFCTSIVPVNMFAAYFMGMTEGSEVQMASDFSVEYATSNPEGAGGLSKTMPLLNTADHAGRVEAFFEKTANTFLSYFGKLLYPRTFSFLSVTMALVVPAMFMSVFLLGRWRKQKEPIRTLLFLQFILWPFLLIYIFRATVSRYLLPVTPILLIFLILFLKEQRNFKQRFLLITLLTTILFSIGGLIFEHNNIFLKIVLNLVILGLLVFAVWKRNSKFNYIPCILLCLWVSVASCSAALLASYQTGQIHNYLTWGANREAHQITSLVSDSKTIWINNFGWDLLPRVYRQDMYWRPEWQWNLRSWVPKKKVLEPLPKAITYDFDWSDPVEFHKYVMTFEIDTVVLVVSDVDAEELSTGNKLSVLQAQPWLEFQGKYDMKNKKVYVWSVNRFPIDSISEL